MSEYVARAELYARAVLSGDRVAGKWEKAACQRFIDDLARQQDDAWPYYLDEAAADHACQFMEFLPHIEGRWESATLVLEDWQCFILVNLFGWLEKHTRLRRFRRFYEEVARKNGKSPIASGIALYLTFCDGEPGAQVYSFATKKDQAKIVWQVARAMMAKEPGFAEWGGAYNTQAIFNVDTNSSFKPLARDFGSLDGLNTHGFIADELHAHKDRGMWDVMDSSTGARSQPLGGGITTAGSDRSGICYEIRGYICRILNGVLHRHDGLGYRIEGDTAEDERWFGIIYTIDDDDDPFDESCWGKANPNLGISVQLEDMRAQAKRAMQMASAQGEFLTKRLNVWVNADHAWMDMRAWDACADKTLSEEQFEGEDAWIALDLASKVDIAERVKLFKRSIDGVEHYYGFAAHYLPQGAIDASRNAQYEGWAREGRIIVVDGEANDYSLMKDHLRADASRFKVVEVPFDPWQANQLASEMLSEGLPMVEFRQIVANMSAPMKELEALVLSGRFHHNGDPVLTWMISNVVCHSDAKDNIYPRKERNENKIDGAVALIMALGRAMVSASKPSVYETRGIRTL